jgi:hypothetical protein
MGASVRTTAQVLQAMLELQPDDPLNPDAVRWLLAARQRDGAWASTHDTAWALRATGWWGQRFAGGHFDFGAIERRPCRRRALPAQSPSRRSISSSVA